MPGLFLAVVVGALAPLLDMTMVSVALADLSRDFDVPLATVQWVTTGYLLAIAAVIPVTGWAVERFGSRTPWLVALTAFTAGSALCAVAWSAGSLIAFRVVQGIGGGMIVPLAISILAREAGPDRRGRVLSLAAIPGQVAPIAGPPLGGLLVDGAGWRWIFLVNLPVGVVALVLARRALPAGDAAPTRTPLDLIGLALLSPGVAALLLGFARAATGAGVGRATVVLPLAVGVALLAGYAYRALRTSGTPAVDLRLFTHRPFAAAAALNVLSRMSVFGATILMPLYYQQVRGESALAAGLLLAPQSIGVLLGLLFAGRLSDRIGPRPVVLAGLAIAVAGSATYTRVGTDTDRLLLAGSLLVWGVGVAAATIPVMAAAYHGLAPTLIPRATGAITTVQTIGASLGAALLVVLVQHEAAGRTDPVALAAAFGDTFRWTLVITALAVLPALLLPTGGPPEPAPTTARPRPGEADSP